MSYSNTQPQGTGHQITPPFQVTPVPAETSTVVEVGPEYGQLCVTAVDDAMNARSADADRAAAVPGPNS